MESQLQAHPPSCHPCLSSRLVQPGFGKSIVSHLSWFLSSMLHHCFFQLSCSNVRSHILAFLKCRGYNHHPSFHQAFEACTSFSELRLCRCRLCVDRLAPFPSLYQHLSLPPPPFIQRKIVSPHCLYFDYCHHTTMVFTHPPRYRILNLLRLGLPVMRKEERKYGNSEMMVVSFRAGASMST